MIGIAGSLLVWSLSASFEEIDHGAGSGAVRVLFHYRERLIAGGN